MMLRFWCAALHNLVLGKVFRNLNYSTTVQQLLYTLYYTDRFRFADAIY